MPDPIVEELRAEVLRIESTIDDGTYEPGPWAKVLRKARTATVEQRRQIVDEVSRTGNKLHRKNWPGPTVSVRAGLIGEFCVGVLSAAGLWYGVEIGSLILIFASTFVLSWVAQPTLKMLIGTLLGVRYAYFYIKYGIEPRVRMQYGTYLVLPWYKQAAFHLCGTVGAVGAVFAVWAWLAPTLPEIAVYLFWLGVVFLAMNVSLIVGGFFGVKYFIRLSSGGQAADLVARKLFGLRAPKAAAG